MGIFLWEFFLRMFWKIFWELFQEGDFGWWGWGWKCYPPYRIFLGQLFEIYPPLCNVLCYYIIVLYICIYFLPLKIIASYIYFFYCFSLCPWCALFLVTQTTYNNTAGVREVLFYFIYSANFAAFILFLFSFSLFYFLLSTFCFSLLFFSFPCFLP